MTPSRRRILGSRLDLPTVYFDDHDSPYVLRTIAGIHPSCGSYVAMLNCGHERTFLDNLRRYESIFHDPDTMRCYACGLEREGGEG